VTPHAVGAEWVVGRLGKGSPSRNRVHRIELRRVMNRGIIGTIIGILVIIILVIVILQLT
jgi:hypothetical protein